MVRNNSFHFQEASQPKVIDKENDGKCFQSNDRDKSNCFNDKQTQKLMLQLKKL